MNIQMCIAEIVVEEEKEENDTNTHICKLRRIKEKMGCHGAVVQGKGI